MSCSRVVGVLAVVGVLGGCGGATGGQGAPATGQEGGQGGAVVLRVEQSNEMIGPRNRLNFLPETSVYADGRVVQRAPFTLDSVGQNSALPAMVQRTVTSAGLEALVERVRAAGVGSGADLGQPPVADAPTTHFTLSARGESVSTDAYALSISAGLDVPIGQPVPSPSIPVGSGEGDGTLTAEQAQARYALLELSAALDDLSAALGADQVGEQVPYQPQAVAVVAAPVLEDELVGQPLSWPGPGLGGQEVAGGSSCTVVAGEEVAPVLAAAEQAQRWSPWSEGGRTWYLEFRPLLPDEATCADLTKALPQR